MASWPPQVAGRNGAGDQRDLVAGVTQIHGALKGCHGAADNDHVFTQLSFLAEDLNGMEGFLAAGDVKVLGAAPVAAMTAL